MNTKNQQLYNDEVIRLNSLVEERNKLNELIERQDEKVKLALQKLENSDNEEKDNERRIILNQIKTPDGTILRSMHRHDYQTHTDKNGLEYMVDGGNEYLRRNVHDDAPYTEMTIYDDEPFEVIRENLHRGGRGKDGRQPLKWTPLSEMSNAWVEACVTYNEERNMGEHFATQMYRKEIEYRKENNINIKD